MSRRRRLGLLALAAPVCAILACGPMLARRPHAAASAAATKATAPIEDVMPAIGADAGDAGADDDDPRFATLEAPVLEAIAEGKLPGCVVVVGRKDEVLFRKAWGARQVTPDVLPMTTGTLFDLASLTKPLATATSLMILADRGVVDLDAPASRWIPELGAARPFTPRQLLVHTSGLPAGTPLRDWTTDRRALMLALAAGRARETKPDLPGTRFVYSDVGFVVLEEIVRRASGEDFASFTKREIFERLGMTETGFLPSPALRARAAPTETRDGGAMLGEVHDPRAFALGGVAGHAGLFGTGSDLARFAQAMLGEGTLDEAHLVGKNTFARFTMRHETPKGARALGWDMESAFSVHRSPLLSKAAFGHGGFTGTAMWIDPAHDWFFVFLSNRVHPDGRGAVNPLVRELATRAMRAIDVRAGIDALKDDGFASLAGAKVGLLTNASARARDGTTTLDVLKRAPGVELRVVFAPEHGLLASAEGRIDDGSEQGVFVESLYGARDTPSDASLARIDTLVVDLQDVGTRFYTYASTMKRAMRAAAHHGIRVVILDRPDPIGGARVEGPVLETDGRSFVNHHALPVVHGMTLGELAGLFAADEALDVRLDVVRARGWRRKDALDWTFLAWTSPSPNLPSVRAAVLYPALGLLEATNVSVGRGTDAPFEVLGAPWLDGDALIRALGEARLEGVTFAKESFTPRASVHAGKPCGGMRVTVTDRARFSPVRTAIAIAQALRRVARGAWKPEGFAKMLGHRKATEAFERGLSLDAIAETWSADLAAFEAKRATLLLY